METPVFGRSINRTIEAWGWLAISRISRIVGFFGVFVTYVSDWQSGCRIGWTDVVVMGCDGV